MKILPTQYKPQSFEDLIGPAGKAGRLAKVTLTKAAQYRQPVKEIFYGSPGSGKSELARLLSFALGKNNLAIRNMSGLLVTIDTVRDWINALSMGGLFGDYQVTVVQELDRMPAAARDLLLDFLDRLPSGHAFIGTSNMAIDDLTERFQSRFQATKILGPTSDEISAFLNRHWPEIPKAMANQLAIGSGGNVRAALNDAEKYLDAVTAHLIAA